MTRQSTRQRHSVLVTGSSSGIGRATAIAFGREGANVTVTYRSNRDGAARTADLVREAGGEAIVVQYDLADRNSIEETVEATVDRWGSLDVLVNNAAPMNVRAKPTPIEEIDPSQWRAMVHTTVDGVFHTLQPAVSPMRENEWGRIVTVSSTAAVDGPPGLGAYATAKAGLHGLTKVAAADLGPSGILANVVTPGTVLTEKNKERIPEETREGIRNRTPSGHLTTPEDVANVVLFLGSEANGNVTGEVIEVAGGS